MIEPSFDTAQPQEVRARADNLRAGRTQVLRRFVASHEPIGISGKGSSQGGRIGFIWRARYPNSGACTFLACSREKFFCQCNLPLSRPEFRAGIASEFRPYCGADHQFRTRSDQGSQQISADATREYPAQQHIRIEKDFQEKSWKNSSSVMYLAFSAEGRSVHYGGLSAASALCRWMKSRTKSLLLRWVSAASQDNSASSSSSMRSVKVLDMCEVSHARCNTA
jgi:hypothetical protein